MRTYTYTVTRRHEVRMPGLGGEGGQMEKDHLYTTRSA